MVKSNYFKLATVVIIGVIAAYFFMQSEETRIKRQLHLLTELVSKDGEEPAITLAQKARKTGFLFTEICEYESRSHAYSGRYTRQDISRQTAAARAQFASLKLKLWDLNIDFPSRKTASVVLTASVTGETKAGGEVNDTHEIELRLEKIGREWLISHVKIVEVLVK